MSVRFHDTRGTGSLQEAAVEKNWADASSEVQGVCACCHGGAIREALCQGQEKAVLPMHACSQKGGQRGGLKPTEGHRHHREAKSLIFEFPHSFIISKITLEHNLEACS